MIDWKLVDTVMLDMDGTLLDLNFDNQFWRRYVPARFADKNGISFDDACKTIYPQMDSIQGSLDWYCIYYWSRLLDLDIAALSLELAHLIQPRPGAMAFLDSLKRHGRKRVWLATNAHQDVINIKFDRVDLTPFLDEVISSHALDAPKESPEFWRRLREQRDFDPDRSLFIDDNTVVLRAARDYGIRHLLTIKQPDLSAPPKNQREFTALDHFNQIAIDPGYPNR